MNKHEFTYLIQQPAQVTAAHQPQLEELLQAFPYFQAAHALQLKILNTSGSYKYNDALKRTAAHTTDRSILFDYITSEVFTQNEVAHKITRQSSHLNQIELVDVEQVHASPLDLEQKIKTELTKAEAVLDPDLFIKVEPPAPSQKLEDQPLAFTKEDKHSFAIWLQLSQVRPVKRVKESPTAKTPDPKEERFKLIDAFLSNSPKIDPQEEVRSKKNLAKPFTKSSDTLMTETLAKVYLQQKNYKKAIQAYKILSLKNPEKSGFFADQIRAINKMIAQNSKDNDSV